MKRSTALVNMLKRKTVSSDVSLATVAGDIEEEPPSIPSLFFFFCIDTQMGIFIKLNGQTLEWIDLPERTYPFRYRPPFDGASKHTAGLVLSANNFKKGDC